MPTRFEEAVELGREAVAGVDTDLLVVGEMGIGNTTAAAALGRVSVRGPTEDWVGAGTGISGDAPRREGERGARRASRDSRPSTIRSKCCGRSVGPSWSRMAVGGGRGARRRSIPVVLDGYGATAPRRPSTGHGAAHSTTASPDTCSAEPGHRRLLARLGLTPLLDLDFRLGEAVARWPPFRSSPWRVAWGYDVPTFGEWFG